MIASRDELDTPRQQSFAINIVPPPASNKELLVMMTPVLVQLRSD